MSHVMKKLNLKHGHVSIQASEYHYCTPRDNEGPYSTWEVGFPSDECPQEAVALLEEYSDGSGVYGFVPTSVVAAFVRACGGAVSPLLHPFALHSPSPLREVSPYQRRVLCK